MAATVVSVVIFVSGVLVGRVVWAQRGPQMSQATSDSTPASDGSSPRPGQSTPPAGANPATPGPASGAHLRYDDRVEKPEAHREALAATVETPPPRPADEAPPAQGVAESSLAEPSGSGYAIQIAVLIVRSEAEAVARRLRAKGYSAYVATPPPNAPTMCRVRVGKFSTRSDAEAVAARLQREEQFNPWITH